MIGADELCTAVYILQSSDTELIGTPQINKLKSHK